LVSYEKINITTKLIKLLITKTIKKKTNIVKKIMKKEEKRKILP
jgi:hypothetical protein